MAYDNTRTLLSDGNETDITPIELQTIEKFKEEGMPGLSAVNDITMTKAIDLYLSGKSYHEISKIVSTKKEIILFLGQKFNWYDTKIQQLQILDATLKERILHAKLVNQDFVLQIQQFFLKKIGRKMTRFMSTNDDEIANAVDRKDIEMYMKSVDLLQKLETEKTPINSRGPAIGLNVGDGGLDIRRVNENEITITPRNKTVGEMLKDLADIKRKEESETKVEFRDITNEDIKNNKGSE